jgi:hypothetical protein
MRKKIFLMVSIYFVLIPSQANQDWWNDKQNAERLLTNTELQVYLRFTFCLSFNFANVFCPKDICPNFNFANIVFPKDFCPNFDFAKVFSPEDFFLYTILKIYFIIILVFKKNAIFRQKSAKMAEMIDHNIGPGRT